MQLGVVDASVLIAFSAIGRLALLRDVFDEVLVPEAVYRETVVDGAGRRAAGELGETIHRGAWLRRVQVAETPLLKQLREELGAGEAEVIALAAQLSAPALIDDLEARNAAIRSGVTIMGSFAVIALCKLRGRIPHAQPLVGQLRAAGIYFSEALVRRFLRSLGEL